MCNLGRQVVQTRHTKCQNADPLEILLLLDLVGLVYELPDLNLKLGELLFCCNYCVVLGPLTDVNLEVDTLEGETIATRGGGWVSYVGKYRWRVNGGTIVSFDSRNKEENGHEWI